MNCGLRLRLKHQPATLMADLARLDELWLDGLNRFGGPFLAGSAFSAVDAFYAPAAFRIQSYGLPLSQSSLAYAQRILDLAGMQAWYTAALAEPWREISHERDILVEAELIQDLRQIPS